MSDIAGVSSEDILHFWFEEVPPEKYFKSDAALDKKVQARFSGVYEVLKDRVPEEWRRSGRGLLAAIIVLDQFPRNMFRGEPQAYATDSRALALSREGIANRLDQDLSSTERQFFYLPFQHSEDPQDQLESIRLNEMLGKEVLSWAERHKTVIDRFGRFPARNAVLGRVSTDEEKAFLDETPLGF